MKNILIVLTSHDRLGDTGEKTGFWLEELAAPYYAFLDGGASVALASPKGGRPPLDPRSGDPTFQTDSTRRFEADLDADERLANTARLDSVDIGDFDAVFYPGGHGPLWDLVHDSASLALIGNALKAGKPVAAVCHAPAALLHVTGPEGLPLLSGKTVTGFSNSEEDAVGLTRVVPFLLEDELKARCRVYTRGPDWQPHVEVDGLLVTGQNPASSEAAAQALLRLLD
jgi:putative intracellular protease/amidase